MIGSSAYAGIAMMIAFGLVVPVALAVWWIRAKKEKVTTVLLGAATWFVFAILLESIPKTIFITPLLPVGKAVTQNLALTIALAALFAGVFEETGRFLVFRFLLKNRRNRETGVSHGLGHGGFEAMYLMLAGGIQNLVYAVMINAGRFQELLDAAAAKGVDASSLEALPAQLAAISPATSGLGMLERLFAIALHVGLSLLVFYAVKRRRIWLYPLAIALHALFDLPAALYQFGVIGNLYAVEGLIAAYAIALLAIVYFALYRKDKETNAAIQNQTGGENDAAAQY